MIKSELKNTAAVADTTSGNVRSIWCEDGYLTTHNPGRILPLLFKQISEKLVKINAKHFLKITIHLFTAHHKSRHTNFKYYSLYNIF